MLTKIKNTTSKHRHKKYQKKILCRELVCLRHRIHTHLFCSLLATSLTWILSCLILVSAFVVMVMMVMKRKQKVRVKNIRKILAFSGFALSQKIQEIMRKIQLFKQSLAKITKYFLEKVNFMKKQPKSRKIMSNSQIRPLWL